MRISAQSRETLAGECCDPRVKQGAVRAEAEAALAKEKADAEAKAVAEKEAADKEAADAEGKTWTSKYLFHIPLQVGTRPKVLDESQQDSTASLGSQTIHSHQTLDGSI